jgi:hypothetical protein
MEFACDAAPYIEVHTDSRQIENFEHDYRILSFQVGPVTKPAAQELAKKQHP